MAWRDNGLAMSHGQELSRPVGPAEARSATAAAVARGTTRLLRALGCSALCELCLPSGRRADIVGLGRTGELWIVEVKSSIEDFQADHKWGDYRLHCDRLFFATGPEVSLTIFPETAGLIVADRFGGQLVRQAPEHRMPAATRRAMTLRFARAAAHRLQVLLDPTAPLGQSSADLFGPGTLEGADM
jgi:hypothetical protein